MNTKNNLLFLFLLSFSMNFFSISMAMDKCTADLIDEAKDAVSRYFHGHETVEFKQKLHTKLYDQFEPLMGSDTFLSTAAKRGNLEMVKLLLDRHANVEDGHPLIEAARYIDVDTTNKTSIINLLLDRGAKPNVQETNNFTALHYILYPYEERFHVPIETITSLVTTLIQHGADINIKNYHWYTPLDLAEKYYPQVAPLMLEEAKKAAEIR